MPKTTETVRRNRYENTRNPDFNAERQMLFFRQAEPEVFRALIDDLNSVGYWALPINERAPLMLRAIHKLGMMRPDHIPVMDPVAEERRVVRTPSHPVNRTNPAAALPGRRDAGAVGGAFAFGAALPGGGGGGFALDLPPVPGIAEGPRPGRQQRTAKRAPRKRAVRKTVARKRAARRPRSA